MSATAYSHAVQYDADTLVLLLVLIVPKTNLHF